MGSRPSSAIPPDGLPSRAVRISWYSILTPILRGWRLLLAVTLLCASITAAVALLTPRKYRASVTLSTVFNPRMSIAGGGLGALLNGASTMGLQATPALIVLLSEQYGVLDRVVHARMNATGTETIGDRLQAVRGRSFPQRELPAELKKVFAAGTDKQTGVITMAVVSPDTMFARRVANELVAEISRTFIRSSKSQASELRIAMQARVDSAVNQLRRADEEFRQFIAANRMVSPYSEAALRRDELERTRNLSQTIYSQAITDRESAVARELEETPAVVVLDGLPRELVHEPRGTFLKTLAAALAGFVLACALLLVREAMRQPESLPELEAFASALRSVPLLGWIVASLLGVNTLGREAPPINQGARL